MKSFKQFLNEENEYRGSHESPDRESGVPMHDLKGVYPEDFHHADGFRQYADQGNDYDMKSYNTVRRVKDKPDDMVWIHRAVPKSVHKEALKTDSPLKHMIRRGDWVTTSKEYAKEHGEAALKGDYHIASKRVPAKHLFTDGNSIHEWGYHPE
jgi:hypothetical protein